MLEQVVSIVREAGKIIRRHYGTDFEVFMKADNTPFTKADIEANALIVKELTHLFPDTPLISEENTAIPYEMRRNWSRFFLIDPLDGTKDFIQKTGEFTVNVGLISRGVPILAVIYAPALDLMYYSEEGRGAYKEEAGGEARRIYSVTPDSKTGVISLESRHHGDAEELEEFLSKLPVRERVRVGSSLKFCYLAEGRAHLYPRFGPTMEWDVAAGDCIWRNSARVGKNKSSLTYNKPTLKNGPFILGEIT